MGSAHRLDGSRATFGGNGVEAGGTHGDDLDRSARLHGGNRVAGVDRTLEGVGGFDRDDFRDLVDVQQRGHAWQHVLAIGGRRGQHMAVALAQLGHQRRYVFRQLMRVGCIVGHQYLGDASDLRGRFGHAPHALACA
ncbi:hypothetical protein PS627_04352 [Pseudomonas fluorescens]|nr:hypothetical protein PS627_04352 [Pseudomonas fluorescens]